VAVITVTPANAGGWVSLPSGVIPANQSSTGFGKIDRDQQRQPALGALLPLQELLRVEHRHAA
jgi:hypothetical protein